MSFKTYKDGKPIDLHLHTPRAYEVRETHYEPLPPERILAIDTESFYVNGSYQTKFLQYYGPKGQAVIDIEGKSGWETLLDFLFLQFQEEEPFPSQSQQRSFRKRKHGRIIRDGRRQYVPPILLAFYNLKYDFSRLIDNEPTLRRVVMLGENSVRVSLGDYEIEICYLNLDTGGSGFQFYVRKPLEKKIIRVIGFDLCAYFKVSLDQLSKELESYGIPSKKGMGKDIFSRDWMSLSEQQKLDFIDYAAMDVNVTFHIYQALVILLQSINPNSINSNGTIPHSASSASAKIAWALMEVPGNEWLSPPLWVQQLGLDAYYGGYSFCHIQGETEHVNILDISSAYPHVMTLLPNPATVEYVSLDYGEKGQEFFFGDWQGKYGILIVSGVQFDTSYPSLLTKADSQEGYRNVACLGTFEKKAVTIPEILAGVITGRLHISRVYGGCLLSGSSEGSGLKKFCEHLYELKSNEPKGSGMRMFTKILLNSLYGKLIEKIHKGGFIPLFDMDNGIYEVRNIPELKEQIKHIYLNEGYEGVKRFMYSNEVMECFPDRKWILLCDLLANEKWVTGRYFNAMYAATITGYIRAKILLYASKMGAIAIDTDAIFYHHSPFISTSHMVEADNLWEKCGYPVPHQGMGSFQDDMRDASGIFIRRKLYALVDGHGNRKEAMHGLVAFKKQHENDYMGFLKNLYVQGQATYMQAPKPLGIRESIIQGKPLAIFEIRDRTISLSQDVFMKNRNGWIEWTIPYGKEEE